MATNEKRKPGEVRDAIVAFFEGRRGEQASVAEIREAVNKAVGGEVAPSSIRSYLRLNEGTTFVRLGRGSYRMKRR